MIIIQKAPFIDVISAWIWNGLLIYVGMRVERWNVKRKAEKEAARKWHESQGPKEPTL